MRELKREDPSELELGLEIELETEDVDAAVAAVAAASEGQIPCSCCDVLLNNAEQLHIHQMEHHSVSELSLALITLRGLDLPLMNGVFPASNEISEEDDSSYLRNILLQTAQQPRSGDSESTITLNSDDRMPLVSPANSPVLLSTFEELHQPYLWNNSSSPHDYSSFSTSFDSSINKNQPCPNSNDSGFISGDKVNTQKKYVGKRKSAKSKNDPDLRQFVCSLCDRRYKKKSHLERHTRVHTGVRPYACPLCDKRFAVHSILKQHIRVHTGERPFSCNVCFQRFPQKSGLMTHMMLHNGKPFKCEYCVKSFVSNHKLMLHQRSHGDLVNGSPNQGPYACSSCKMHFFTTGALAEHAKVHVSQSTHSLLSPTQTVSSEDVTISEQAARAAVSAIGRISNDYSQNDESLLEFEDKLSQFESNIPDLHDEFLNVKNEIFIDDEEEGPFFCAARWSGIEDMYIGADFNNGC